MQRGAYKYMGEWLKDLREGEGKCVFVDDSFYDGSWQGGVR